ncbi:tetratricopeptide repeat protein [Streptomyces sp. NPDC059980]|uniref:tetratricopeptide repeat protein n=1 Tax=Streptomyces sp. NPDC059980 TaxID=3347022 RepID=UPI0036CA3A2D
MTEKQRARELFADELKKVLGRAGSPTYDALAKRSGERLSSTRIGAVLKAQFIRPVTWEFVDAFLTACAQYAKSHNITAEQSLYDRDKWRTLHKNLTEVLERDEPGDAAPTAFTVEPYPAPSRLEGPAARPSYLLSAHSQVVPFTGREEDLEKLLEWQLGDEKTAAILLHAPGGQGKTRLAARLAEAAGPGWRTWQAVRGSAETGAIPPTVPSLGRRVLLVVDYAERWPKSELRTLLETLAKRRSEKIRVLLLARSAGIWWTSWLHDLHKLGYLCNTLGLPPLSGQHTPVRKMAFGAARDSFAAALGLTKPEVIPYPVNLEDEAFGLTLTIHMAALAAVYARCEETAAPDDPLSLSRYLLDRECAYWDSLHDYGPDVEIGPQVMAQAVYTATLTRPLDYGAALKAVAHADIEVPVGLTARRVLRDHAACYPPTDPAALVTCLEPLYPDRLGEDFIALATPGSPSSLPYPPPDWADEAPSRLLAAVNPDPAPSLPWTRDALTILINTAERWPHIAERQLYPLLKEHPELALHAGGSALAALAGLKDLDVTVLETIEPHLPASRHTDLDVGIAAMSDRLARQRLISTRDPETRAGIYQTLATRQSHAGLRGEALTSGTKALQEWRHLADSSSEYRPHLALSLSNLGVFLSEVGRRGEALANTQEAVDVYRLLAAQYPAAYRPNLAGVLSNLGMQLSEVGRREEALVATREAVDVYRQLVADHCAEYEHNLAGTLSNLGMRLSEVGRREEALVATREAVDVYRQLVADSPAVYEPDLGRSLSNLGMWLSNVGRQGEALDAEMEAVAIRRGLAEGNPAAHEPDLARSLSNLGVLLREVGRRDEAVTATQGALAVNRRLATDNPAVHESDLATSLSNLGVLLSDVGRYDDAVTTAQEAVDVNRRLAADRPAVCAPDLARSLSNLGIFLSEVGRRDEALAATQEAVDAYRRLTADRPGIYEPNLAGVLSNLGLRLSEVGRPNEAFAATQEALDVYVLVVMRHSSAHDPDVAIALAAHAWVRYRARQDLPEALQATGRAVEIYRKLITASPERFRSLLFSVLGLQADLLLRLGQPRKSREIRAWLAVNAAHGTEG